MVMKDLDEFKDKERRPGDHWMQEEMVALSTLFDRTCNRDREKKVFWDGIQHEIMESRVEYLQGSGGAPNLVTLVLYLQDSQGETHTLLFEEKSEKA